MTFTPHRTVARARSLRRGQTPAEQRLWGYLRGRRLGGHKFARQVPVGAYIADFVCREPKLVVEVDGATHSEDSEISYDASRERFLKAEGYKVLRVLNDDVYNRVGDVLDMILMALEGRFERDSGTAMLRIAALIRSAGTFSRASHGRRAMHGMVRR